MRIANLVLAAAMAVAMFAQNRMSVDQLVAFIRSSVELGHQDKVVAEHLRKIKLTQKLDEDTITELRAAGAGPKTMEALHALEEASKALPAPPPQLPKAEAPQVPPPGPEEQDRIIKAASEYALNYTKQLPDFICTQVTRRYYDPTGLEFWRSSDVITARLSYFEQKENYKLTMINGRLTDKAYDSIDGATSTGEFGSMMREIFEPGTDATFRWERWATLRGKRAHVYSYLVAQPRSRWRIDYEKRLDITPGYKGLIYIDRDTEMVMRITLEAVDIPATFPVQQASTVLDYDYTDIAGNEYMLPLKAVVRMREGKNLVKNEVEFRLYRKFAAEATVTFDTPPPLPEEKTTEQPPKP